MDNISIQPITFTPINNDPVGSINVTFNGKHYDTLVGTITMATTITGKDITTWYVVTAYISKATSKTLKAISVLQKLNKNQPYQSTVIVAGDFNSHIGRLPEGHRKR